MYNPYPVLFKLRDFVDPEKFAQTLVKNLQAHPAFLSVIEEHNGSPVQGYVLAKVPSIPVEKIADAGLLRIKFTHAPQNFHDGQDIEPDAWFAYLQEREAPKSSPHYAESKKWHEDFYGHHDFYGYHAADFAVLEEGLNKQGLRLTPSGTTDNSLDTLRHFHLTRTDFFTGENFATVREQTKSCLAHKNSPYTSLDEKMLEDDKLCVLYHYHGDLHNSYFIDVFIGGSSR